jgi:hypothetical protein
MLKNLKIEAKQRQLILNCKSSEAKRSKANVANAKNQISEAKRTGLF